MLDNGSAGLFNHEGDLKFSLGTWACPGCATHVHSFFGEDMNSDIDGSSGSVQKKEQLY